MAWELSDNADIIDSRDINTRLADLGSTRDLLQDAVHDAETDEARTAAEQALTDWDDADEYATLGALCDEGERSFSDWAHGESLIRDSYFEDYARELADDIGAIPTNAGWPCTHIDWEAAAEALQQDYTSIEIDGTTYWGRS